MVSKILDLGFRPFDRCLPGASPGLSTQNQSPGPILGGFQASRRPSQKDLCYKVPGVIHMQGRVGRGVAAGPHNHTLIWILTPPLHYCVTLDSDLHLSEPQVSS